jgi:hypothetical protein
MATCAHKSLRREEDTHYRCAACGLLFVVLRVEDEAPEETTVEERPAPPAEVDVSERIGQFVPAKRRLKSNRRK